MVNLGSLLATAPTGFWESIIGAFNNTFLNYALAIIMLTLCIKLILLPTDYLNKYITRKTSRAQAELKPELEAIEKKYGKDPQVKNQKVQELYKKKGVKIGGSCIVTLVTITVSMLVFITLFSGLNKMSAYKITSQYEQLEVVYDQNIGSKSEQEILNANEQVRVKYDEIKDSFLWIKNVWIAESPLKNPIPSFDEYKAIAKSGKIGEEYKEFSKMSEEELANAKEKYEAVMGPLRENQGVNGYFILTIIVAGCTVLMQLVSQGKFSKKKNVMPADPNQGAANKVMLVLMPALMGYICLSTNSVFALYLVASQIFSCATTPLIDLILNKFDKKKEDRQFEEQMKKKGRIVR